MSVINVLDFILFSYVMYTSLVFCFAYKLKPFHIIVKAAANGRGGKQLASNVFFL